VLLNSNSDASSSSGARVTEVQAALTFFIRSSSASLD
jgi:hypothetical protein